MPNNDFKGYDKPNFDGRVKNLLQIENIYHLLAKITAMLVVSLILMLFLGSFVKAQSVPDLFLVPTVSLTPSGAAVYQPQTGDGAEFLPGQRKANAVDLNSPSPSGSGTGNDIYSRSANYRAPQYDAFAEGSGNMVVRLPIEAVKKVESVDFKISNNMSGGADRTVGTTKTTFNFTADAYSQSLNSLDLEYRWDFGNDGQLDSYFSKIKSISHVFPAAGEYEIKLEVLDKAGNVYAAVKRITVVENDAPNAFFRVDKISAPINSIIKFDTSLSSDNQYTRYNLKYRFDWDGDGKFDTNFQNKNSWHHQFTEVGRFNVIMEVIDPEGATAQAAITIDIIDDTPPQALMSVSRNGNFNYQFDASQSYDDNTPLRSLKFRWDFNYNGSDDIVFDTGWTGTPKYSGTYHLGGTKKIRLQVMDQQGFVGENYAEIDVPWTEDYVNLAVGLL